MNRRDLLKWAVSIPLFPRALSASLNVPTTAPLSTQPNLYTAVIGKERSGKTWVLIRLATEALQQGKKVLWIGEKEDTRILSIFSGNHNFEVRIWRNLDRNNVPNTKNFDFDVVILDLNSWGGISLRKAFPPGTHIIQSFQLMSYMDYVWEQYAYRPADIVVTPDFLYDELGQYKIIKNNGYELGV